MRYRRWREIFPGNKKQRGLAHPRLRDQHLEAELTIDPIDQGSERFPVSFTVEEEPGVGSNSKGVFPQSKMAKQLILYRICGGIALARGTGPANLLQIDAHRRKAARVRGFRRIRGVPA